MGTKLILTKIGEHVSDDPTEINVSAKTAAGHWLVSIERGTSHALQSTQEYFGIFVSAIENELDQTTHNEKVKSRSSQSRLVASCLVASWCLFCFSMMKSHKPHIRFTISSIVNLCICVCDGRGSISYWKPVQSSWVKRVDLLPHWPSPDALA